MSDTVHYVPTHVQVLEVVRSNYDTLTLKLHDSLDHFEKYAEKPKETTFFTHLVSGGRGYIQCQSTRVVVSEGCGYIQCQSGQWGAWLYTVPEWSVGGVAIYNARMVSGRCGYIQCQDGTNIHHHCRLLNYSFCNDSQLGVWLTVPEWSVEVWLYAVPECQNYTS